MSPEVNNKAVKEDDLAQIIENYESASVSYEQSRLSKYMQLIEKVERDIIAHEVIGSVNQKALEVGCGTGRFSEFLSSLGYDVTAIDISPSMLRQAKKLRGHIPTINWVNATAESLPLSEDSFDFVVALKVLPHVLNLQKSVTEVSRVLKKGGKAVLEFYNPISIGSLSRRYGFFTRWNTPSQVEELLLHSGLNIIRRRGVRTLIPFGFLMSVPVINHFFEKIETQLSNSWLCRFSSYYIAVVRSGH